MIPRARSHAFASRLARLAVLALLCALLPSLALAAEPGTSPLEQAAGAAASEIAAGKPVRVGCHDRASWASITAERGIDPLVEGFAQVADGIAHLAPRACAALDDVWTGSPPACSRFVPYTVTVRRVAWVNVKRRVRVRVNGELVWRVRTVRVRKVVARRVVRERSEPADCFTRGEHAVALLTLAHEAIHVGGVRDEAVAECHGIQRIGLVAQRLGLAPAAAAALMATAWARYPFRVGTAYHSPECRAGGSLDLTPNDNAWP